MHNLSNSLVGRLGPLNLYFAGGRKKTGAVRQLTQLV